jgi:hypothetical protein
MGKKKSEREKVFKGIRNVFASLTAVCLIVSFFLHGHHLLIRGIGYCFGAVAYFSELLEITEGFQQKRYLDDLFMAVCFGMLYIMLAVSYILEHAAY